MPEPPDPILDPGPPEVPWRDPMWELFDALARRMQFTDPGKWVRQQGLGALRQAPPEALVPGEDLPEWGRPFQVPPLPLSVVSGEYERMLRQFFPTDLSPVFQQGVQGP